jgi:septum site-determining protein MinD
MLSSKDILDILNIKLLGKIPEDKRVIDASNQGRPIILDNSSEAGNAYKRISNRMCGKSVEMKDIEIDSDGFLRKLAGIFK